jgi:hypothetical protein
LAGCTCLLTCSFCSGELCLLISKNPRLFLFYILPNAKKSHSEYAYSGKVKKPCVFSLLGGLSHKSLAANKKPCVFSLPQGFYA